MYIYVSSVCLFFFFFQENVWNICAHPHPFELPCISRMDKKEKTLATKYSSKTKEKEKRNAPLRELFSSIDVKTQERGEGSLASSKARSLKI